MVCGENEELCGSKLCLDLTCDGLLITSAQGGRCKCAAGFIRHRKPSVGRMACVRPAINCIGGAPPAIAGFNRGPDPAPFRPPPSPRTTPPPPIVAHHPSFEGDMASIIEGPADGDGGLAQVLHGAHHAAPHAPALPPPSSPATAPFHLSPPHVQLWKPSNRLISAVLPPRIEEDSLDIRDPSREFFEHLCGHLSLGVEFDSCKGSDFETGKSWPSTAAWGTFTPSTTHSRVAPLTPPGSKDGL